MIPSTMDSIDKAELTVLRKQLKAFPEALREQARGYYLMNEDKKQRDLQDFQMVMIGRLEKILRKRMVEDGTDFRKFRIGGYDRGVYERFYRIEPAEHMSKPQFAIALYRCFGDELKSSEHSVSKMYDSFDPRCLGEMDWRSVLLLILITMQPDLPSLQYFRWAYALYSSVGSLDLDCHDCITLDNVKQFICVPIYLVKKNDIRDKFDEAWMELVGINITASNMMRDKIDPMKGSGALMINFKLFEQLLTMTSFSKLLEVAKPFGTRDSRPWSYVLEELYYHPHILKRVKDLRRIARNEDEVKTFKSMVEYRRKREYYAKWMVLLARRNRVRYLIIQTAVRWKCDRIGSYFDRWKASIIRDVASTCIGRFAKGFIGRRRFIFMKQLRTRTVKMQSTARQYFSKLQYRNAIARRVWGATCIQRHFRGFVSRRRVKTMVEEIFDIGIRNLATTRKNWYEARQLKAVHTIQMCVRRWRFKRAVRKRVEMRIKAEYSIYEMELHEKQNDVDKQVYRENLIEWFKNLKIEYEKYRQLEDHSMEEKKKIFAYRNRNKLIEAEEKKQKAEARVEREEEIRVEMWLKGFEERKITRTRDKELQCKRCLLLPESPEDLLLKKMILDRAKKHVKAVLRRADKQKIPMEIPEAQEIATAEIIEQIVAEELAIVVEEGKREAADYIKAQEEKARQAEEKLVKQRKLRRKWGATVIQGLARSFIAKKELRKRAYARYEKHFDGNSMCYYYSDRRTRKTYWNKPKSLSHYDVDPSPGWMVLFDAKQDIYYYNPAEMTMQYEQPGGTIVCVACHQYFAVVRMQETKRMLCEYCCQQEVDVMINEHNMAKTDITFRPFDGNRSTASSISFVNIKSINWQAYLMKMDPSLSGLDSPTKESSAKTVSDSTRKKKMEKMRKKQVSTSMSMDEEEPPPEFNADDFILAPPPLESSSSLISADGIQAFPTFIGDPSHTLEEAMMSKKVWKSKKAEDAANAEALRKETEAFEDNIVVTEPCTKCKLSDAKVQCNMCMSYYCEKCYYSNHRKPPWTAHSFIEVNKHLKIPISNVSAMFVD